MTGYELDVKSVEYLVRKARMLGIQTILNPSPVPNQKPGFWDCVDILVLNEVEAAHMLRLADGQPTEQWEETARKLRAAYGCRQVVVTLGPVSYTHLGTSGYGNHNWTRNLSGNGDECGISVFQGSGSGRQSGTGVSVPQLRAGLSQAAGADPCSGHQLQRKYRERCKRVGGGPAGRSAGHGNHRQG